MNRVFVIILFLTNYSWAEETKPIVVGILAALPQEIEGLRKVGKFETRTLGDTDFHSGKIEGRSVVIALSGGGKVNAAVTAQRLISDYQVSVLIFTGVGGGINSNFEVGDVVIATDTLQHDYGYLGEKFVPHAVGTMPELGIGNGKEAIKLSLLNNWKKESNSKSVIETVKNTLDALEKNLESVFVDGKKYHPKIRVGVVATGDQFIANDSKKKELHSLGADVVEMEGGAIAQVAEKGKIPFLLIRVLSDKASGNAKIDFKAFLTAVSTNNGALVKAILKSNLLEDYISR